MKPFKFKEFSVSQDKTAMKIGTDAVLLGAWCAVENHLERILDIGSGTGIIALMLAQRSNAITIDAIEVEENAFEQTVENFERSSWGDRLYCYHGDFEEFARELDEEGETYELIVSNPPFYTEAYETKDSARNKARFTSALSFETLLRGVAAILDKTGTFATVIPYKKEEEFVALAAQSDLFLNRVCRVRGSETTALKRSLLEFSFEKKDVISEELTIEKERHQYTRSYIELTKEFYLKF